MEYNIKNIRNFAIVAHINHGKSTLSDVIIKKDIYNKNIQIIDQFLDNMDVEKKHGVTVKTNHIQIYYKYKGTIYNLCIVDTPGHIDFNYEVSRALKTCEGVILLIDAVNGIQAQTVHNYNLVKKENLFIIPVINKIDIQNINLEVVKNQFSNFLKIKKENIICISSKNDINIDCLIEEIITKIPCPSGDSRKPLKAIIFDSYYDKYKGIVMFLKVINGEIRPNDRIYLQNKEVMMVTKNIFKKRFSNENINILKAGEIGMISCNVKNKLDNVIGDTVTLYKDKDIVKKFSGYQRLLPVVYFDFYTYDTNIYKDFKKALVKIKLNDDSIEYEPCAQSALGHGFKIGFLGVFHMKIIKERLKNEFHIDVFSTTPTVKYKIYLKNNEVLYINSPANFPKKFEIEKIMELYCELIVITPNVYYGRIIEYSIFKRAEFVSSESLFNDSTLITFTIPLSELIVGYFDRIKSISKGYATIDYKINTYGVSKLEKLDIMLNQRIIPPLSIIIPKKRAYEYSRLICDSLKKILPKHNFEIIIQAAINNKIIARSAVKAYRKDVTAKLYGGDVTRKQKLLKKQKKGKKRMKQFGNIKLNDKVFNKLTTLLNKT